MYQTLEEKFGITPLADSAYDVEYIYFKYPDDLVLYTDTMIIPERFKHVVIDGAIMFIMRFRSNEQSAAMHQRNFEEGIKAMRRILMDDNLYIRSTVIQRPANSTFSSVV